MILMKVYTNGYEQVMYTWNIKLYIEINYIAGKLDTKNIIYINLISKLGVHEFLDETDTISREQLISMP